jgi:hypothetical protein
VQRWVLGTGQTRDLKAIFGMLSGVIAKTVQIRDPYCLSSDENRRHLAAFIRELCLILAEPGQLTVTYRHETAQARMPISRSRRSKSYSCCRARMFPSPSFRTGGGTPRTTSMTDWSTSSRRRPRPWRASIRSS